MKSETQHLYLNSLGDGWRTIQAITAAMGKCPRAAGAVSKAYGLMERSGLVEWRVINYGSQYRLTPAGRQLLSEAET